MDINKYLDRINYTGSRKPTEALLRALHRAHLLAISYENLDIHLGYPLVLAEESIYEKIVTRRRGGWCYEMNGLFAWALRELGFHVQLLAGTVRNPERPDAIEGNHLALLVRLERPYLADVGFGNGFLEPLPLLPGSYQQNGYTYHLSHDGPRWFFHNHAQGGAGFDFTLHSHRLADFADQNHNLQTSPDSPFVNLTVCHRFTPQGIISLRGAVLKQYMPDQVSEQIIDSGPRYTAVLADIFDLQLTTGDLWARVWKNHGSWVQQNQTSAPNLAVPYPAPYHRPPTS
ncbi:MAG: arylamine N-acetyltransferase [Anaerolinea sp.]|nr:arylamine N-acetyltransferase [Anaerolinea sp.]